MVVLVVLVACVVVYWVAAKSRSIASCDESVMYKLLRKDVGVGQ